MMIGELDVILIVCFSGLKDEIRKVCQEEFLVCGEGDEQGSAWMEKVRFILLTYIDLFSSTAEHQNSKRCI